MARKERTNVDYFPHPVTHGKKMFYIENKYGNDGYSAWFKILEELGAADNHYLNLNDEATLMYISSRCHLQEDSLHEIISDLVRLGEFEKEFWDHGYIVNKKFLKSIEEAYRKRNNTLITLEELRSQLITSAGNTQASVKTPEHSAGNTQRIGEDRIGEDRKEENSENKISLGRKKPSKKGPDFIDRIIDAFIEEYEKANDIPYEIPNKQKERSAAGKVLKLYKEKYPDADSEQTLESLRAYFRASIRINDGWLRDNMSLPIIISKFNVINKILKNGNQRTKANPGVSEAEFSQILQRVEEER